MLKVVTKRLPQSFWMAKEGLQEMVETVTTNARGKCHCLGYAI
jgi:hypothetical protein